MTGILLTAVFAGMLMLEMLLNEKENIVKLIVWAVMKLAMLYVIISGFMFWLDKFGIQRVLGMIAVFELLGILWLYRQGKRPSFICEYKSLWIPIVVSIIALPFTWQKFGYFGMGQDQGVYQTEAISIIYGDGALQHNFDEYESLSSEEQEYFEDAFNSYLLGLYPYDETTAEITGVEPVGNFSYVYHGTHTFSALLALWGSIFGIENMQGIQTIFYLCAIFLLFFICGNLQMKSQTILLCTMVFAFSPMILWISKIALTEMLLADLMMWYIYYMTKPVQKWDVYMATAAIITFAFYHITIYTIAPIFIGIFIIKAFKEKDIDYIKASILSVIGTISGLFMNIYTATHYSVDLNFDPLYKMVPFVNAGNIKPFLIGVLVFLFLIHGELYRLCIKNMRIPIKIPYKRFKVGIKILMLLMGLYQVKLLLEGIPKYGSIWLSIEHMTFVGFLFFSGIILLAVFIGCFYKNTDLFLKDKNIVILFVLFLYCVALYSCLFRDRVAYYYYYGRYQVPFIAIIILLGGICIGFLKNKYIVGILVIVVLGYLPFDLYIAQNNDDTKIQWSLLEELTNIIQSEDVVIIDDSVMTYCYLPIRIMTGATVYRDFEDVSLADYYISEKSLTGDLNKIVYANQKSYEEYKVAPQDTKGMLPLSSDRELNTIVCTQVNAEELEYFVGNGGSYQFSGIGATEGEFAWTQSETVSLETFFGKRDYTLTLNLGTGIPLRTIQKKSYTIKIYVNGNDAGEMVVTDESQIEASINIPSEFIKNGINQISFESDLWRLSDYIDGGDSRWMGFPIQGVIFK